MRHSFQTGNDGQAGYIPPQAEVERLFIIFINFTFQNIAQGHHGHFFIWHFDADVAVTGHRRLDADARRGQGEREIIGKGCDFADADFRADAASGLKKERLHSELRDCWPAADCYYLRWRAKGSQGLFY